MDTESFLQLLWDWCWTHTGTDVFVWLWVNISVLSHTVTRLHSVLILSKLFMFFSCFSFHFFTSLDAFWLVWDLESVPPNLCCCLNPDAWLAPFSFAWPRGVRVIYGKWNPALKFHLKHCIQKLRCFFWQVPRF